MRFAYGIFTLTLVLLAACGRSSPPAATPAAPAAPALETIATTKQVMLGITIPTSNVIFQLADNVPKDDAGWDVVKASALSLAESGNLLLTGARNLQQPEWTQYAQQLIDSAKAAAAAVDGKDVDRILEAGNAVYESCDACHKKYMPARQGV